MLAGVLVLLAFIVTAAAVTSSGGDDGSTTSTATMAAPAATTSPPDQRSEVTVLTIKGVTCTVELLTHPCRLAVDGDPTTAWNAPTGGIGAEIRVRLDQPARVSRLVLTNHADDADLIRNARIARVIVHFEGSDEVVDVSLEDSHGPYRIPVPLVFTSALSLHIEEIHPAADYQGLPAFDELAVAELDVVGFPGTG